MTAIKFTQQQEAAIATRDVSVGLSAGAGCGKTFVMTERYLSELEPTRENGPVAIDRLVAITFTDAAARELRDRIRTMCRERLDSAPPDQRGYWRRLSRSIDSARISTIHAFCGAVLREHAFDLGLDPGFTVLEPGAARSIENSVFAELLREKLQAADADVLAVAEAWGIDGLRGRLRAVLGDWRDDLAREWLALSTNEIIARWKDYFANEFQPSFIAEAFAAGHTQTMIAALADVERRTADDADHIANLIELLEWTPTADKLDEYTTSLKELGAIKGALHYKRWPDANAKNAFSAAREALQKQLAKAAEIDWTADEVIAAAKLGHSLLAVASEFRRRYLAEKASRNALDFDDLLSEMHRLATAPVHAAIVTTIQRGTQLMMVDEFQDTDPRQVEILQRLVGAAAATGGLFFVGDSKQSIYRFRGAAPAVFDALRGSLPPRGQLPLSLNFRSQPAILDFVNALFGHVFAGYERLEAAREQTTVVPAVEFLWAEYPDEKPTWSVDRQRRHEAVTIARRIRELLDTRAEIVGCRRTADNAHGRRAVEQRDIAILFRALSNVRYYEEALRDVGIDYYLVGGRAFYAQQEIYDVLHLLRSVASECDSLSLLGLFRSPWLGVADEALVALAAKPGDLAARLLANDWRSSLPIDEANKLLHARTVLSELRARKASLPPAELLERAIELTGYDAAQIGEFLGERKLANLEKLIEMARSATAAGVGSLDEFTSQLADYTIDPPHEPPASTSGAADNVVRLMTLHQAKGLEFPVVVVADTNRKRQHDRVAAKLDADLGPVVSLGADVGEAKLNAAQQMLSGRENAATLEELDRLFYVACTRAADYLILSSAMCKFDGTGDRWIETLAQSFDIATGECHVVGSNAETLVNRVNDTRALDSHASDRRGLGKAITTARERPGPVPSEIGEIAVDPTTRRRFSVTRLSGKLVAQRPHFSASDAIESSRDGLDPLGFGTLVHAVLERVDFAKPDHARDWAARLAPYHDLLHAHAAASEAASLVTEFCRGDLAKAIAGSQLVRRELEFLFPWTRDGDESPLLLRGYIDLLYRAADGRLWIVDYKTNRVTNEGVTELAANYELQMHLYAYVIETTLGESPAGMTLAFLGPGVDYNFEWNDRARSRALELVNEAIDRALADEKKMEPLSPNDS